MFQEGGSVLFNQPTDLSMTLKVRRSYTYNGETTFGSYCTFEASIIFTPYLKENVPTKHEKNWKFHNKCQFFPSLSDIKKVLSNVMLLFKTCYIIFNVLFYSGTSVVFSPIVFVY